MPCFCNFLCSKSCSKWVFSRATFCAPNRAPDGCFRVQLFVLQIVLQMGVFSCNFLCSKSCSRWVFSRAPFCAPNRAPDGFFRVQRFLCSMPYFTTGRVTYAHFARGSSTFFQNRAFFRECFCAINRVFFLLF